MSVTEEGRRSFFLEMHQRVERLEKQVSTLIGATKAIAKRVVRLAVDPVIPGETIRGAYWPTMRKSEREALVQAIEGNTAALIANVEARKQASKRPFPIVNLTMVMIAFVMCMMAHDWSSAVVTFIIGAFIYVHRDFLR